MEKKKRSPTLVIGFAVLIGFLVIALLNYRMDMFDLEPVLIQMAYAPNY